MASICGDWSCSSCGRSAIHSTPTGTFAGTIRVCPVGGDTRCSGVMLEVLPQSVTVRATATATDDSGDAIIYTFTAMGGPGGPVTVGPQAENVADLVPAEGEWTVAVEVDDDAACDDAPGTCSATVSIVLGTPVYIGDTNCDAKVDIADAVCTLGYLLGGAGNACANPCCKAGMDANDSGSVDIADAVTVLSFLFSQEILTAPGGLPIGAGEDGCFLYPVDRVTLPCDTQCTP